MSAVQHVAGHLRGIHNGGNWTERDVKQQLEGLDWRVAVREVPGFNTSDRDKTASITVKLEYEVE